MKPEVAEVLVQAGDPAREPYRRTPLDFIDNQRPSWLVDLQPYLGFRLGPLERPIPRFTNDRLPIPTAGALGQNILATILLPAIYLAGWHLNLPTRLELILWRTSSLVIIGLMILIWIRTAYWKIHSWSSAILVREAISKKGPSGTAIHDTPRKKRSVQTTL